MGPIPNPQSPFIFFIIYIIKLEYDVAALGNHEFDYGITQLETCERLLNCKNISCNYCFHKNKTSIYPGYKILEVDGKKLHLSEYQLLRLFPKHI